MSARSRRRDGSAAQRCLQEKRTESDHRIEAMLMRTTELTVEMDRQGSILWAPHTTVLVAFAKVERRRDVTKLGGASITLCCVLVVDKDDMLDADLVETPDMVQGVDGLLGGAGIFSPLGGSIEPLEAFFRLQRHAHFTLDLSHTQSKHGSRVVG